MTEEEFWAYREARWRLGRPRIYALLDALHVCLFGDGYYLDENRRDCEDALIAMHAAANRGCEIPDEDVDQVCSELLWPSAMVFERRSGC